MQNTFQSESFKTRGKKIILKYLKIYGTYFLVVNVLFILTVILRGITILSGDALFIGQKHSDLNIIILCNAFGLLIPAMCGIDYMMNKNYGQYEIKKVTKIIIGLLICVISIFSVLKIFTNAVIFTDENEVKVYSPLNLSGKKYSYDDIKSIKTGFTVYNSKQYIEYFYYKVYFSESEFITIDIDYSKYNTDEFVNKLEVLDLVLMRNGVEREVDYKTFEYVNDQIVFANLDKTQQNKINAIIRS